MTVGRSYLFVTWEGGGNVPVVLGVARRLAQRGHRVRVLTEPCLEGAVRAAGADFLPFTRHFTRTDRAQTLLDDAKARTTVGALRRSFEVVLFGPARITAEETRAAILAEPTDVVAVDHLMPGALAAAEAAGTPRVVLFHTPEYLPGPGRPAAGPGFLPRQDLLGRARDALLTAVFLRTVGGYVERYNEARRTMNLRPLRSAKELLKQYHQADLRLILTSAAFDFPIDPAPANVRYVGPVLDDPDWADARPVDGAGDASHGPRGAANAPLKATGAELPLVVASLSSTFQDQGPVLRRIIAALGSLPVRGLVTLGPAMEEDFDELPANVQVLRSLPHSAVFPRANAVITHAGHGTVMRALASGVPLLCLPMGRDQDDNAARVVARGAGLRLKASTGPDGIARAVRRLVTEPDFAARAQELGRRIRADVAEDRAVEELERVGLVQGVAAAYA